MLITAVACAVVIVLAIVKVTQSIKEEKTTQAVVGKVEAYVSDDDHYNLCMRVKKCKLLAEVGYYEARNQHDDGVAAVMHVALNRVKSDRFPETSLRNVVYKPKQFSYTHDGSMKKGFSEKYSYKRVAVIANKVLQGYYEDVTMGSDHYHTTAIKPKWKWEKLKKTVTIGDHVFYRYKE